MPSIIVHGGAGRFLTELLQPAEQGCRAAADHAYAMLRQGATALDAVEAAVRLLEDDPVFNAGTGAARTDAGTVELDAIIVDGAAWNFGAVAALDNVKNPVTVARAVMDESPHCFLVGAGATAFARRLGAEPLPPLVEQHVRSGPDTAAHGSHGTVGAVALDDHGHIATATSTGGTRGKWPGRVGDSPLIGCGAAAEDGIGGASATGVGEGLMRVMMARAVLDYIRAGHDAMTASAEALKLLEQRVNGSGGVIALDAQGRIGHAHNTPHMAWAAVDIAGGRHRGL